ncbi:divergent polysaccharide deacetylase family protein [Desulfovibrio sp. OttesenSCG-928-F20]|nr:divergent polysaccharide deacetylase family protein [Desulfovibrio sp. OttesenSCG-928-F20]
MSPPAKKSASGKSAAQSGAKKSASKSASKKDGQGKVASKKPRSKKKKKGSRGKALLVAFAAGLLVAVVSLYFLRDLSWPEFSLPQFSPPVIVKDAASPQSEPRSKPPGDPPKEREEADETVASAVASALIDLQNLPYEESLHASLDERIRQVDYALMQAAWIRKLPARAMRLASVEDRLEGVEPYQFQVIDILPGKRTREFGAAFKECLAAWAEGASLVEVRDNAWSVSVGGVHTHSIRLYPGREDFAPLPGKSPSGDPTRTGAMTPKPAPLPNMAPPRVRAGGEAPKLVIVIDDLGANASALKQLLELDFPVTAAFWPHGAHTTAGARAAHAKGREIIVHLPMEPLGYPKVQPGPKVLLSGMDEARIRKTVLEGIAAVPHAVGLNNHMGSRFTQSREGVGAVIRLLKERGLFMLDSVTHSRSVFAAEGRRLGIEHYRRNVFLDVEHSRTAVLEALKRAERIALLSGQAVAIGHPLPQTLAALKDWQRLRDKRVHIVKLRDLAQE